MTARARPFRLVAPVVAEHPLQKQIADMLRVEVAAPGKVSKQGVVWWSADIANYGGSVPGIRVGRGLIAGIPDLFLLWRGVAHFIEIKTASPAAELSHAQRSVAAALLAAGGRVGVVCSAADVLALLDAWSVPRARRVTP